MEMRICSLQIACDGNPQPIENFPLRNRFTKRRQSYCIKCRSEMGKNWYANNKEYQKANARKHSTEYRDAMREFLWNYKLTHSCQGPDGQGYPYNATDPVVLEFHHLHGKDMAVSEMVTRFSSVERVAEELKRCQVLCANCHRRVTAKERK